jgi:hypothetical protein
VISDLLAFSFVASDGIVDNLVGSLVKMEVLREKKRYGSDKRRDEKEDRSIVAGGLSVSTRLSRCLRLVFLLTISLLSRLKFSFSELLVFATEKAWEA